MVGEDIGKGAVEEFEKNTLPALITEFNQAVGVFNLKVANVIDLGNKLAGTLDRAVAVLERMEKKLANNGLIVKLP